MHPIERLRYVARADGGDDGLLVREAAGALAALGTDTGGLVLSAKRLLERHPSSGPLWSLCARVLCAGDARIEPWRVVDELECDTTARELAAALPDEAVVSVVGWPEVVAESLPRRGDLEVLVIDAGGGLSLVRRLLGSDVDAVEVPSSGLGAAVSVSDVVVLEATALGPTGFVAPSGSRAAAAVARHAGIPVWLVVGAGRALPRRLWETVVARVEDDEPWESDTEVVPLDLVDTVVGPDGVGPVATLAGRADCPAAPELLGGT